MAPQRSEVLRPNTALLGLPPTLVSSSQKPEQSPDAHLYNAENELQEEQKQAEQKE